MRYLSIINILSLGLLSASSFSIVANAQNVTCGDSTNHTQFEMNVCASRDYETADRALNAAWKIAYKNINKTDNPPPLLAAQRAWITYRDNQCSAEADRYRGGTIQPLIRSSCLARMTRARTEELLLFASDY